MKWLIFVIYFAAHGSSVAYADLGFDHLTKSGESCYFCHSSPDSVKDYPFANFTIFKQLPFKKDPSCSYCHNSNLVLKTAKSPHWVPLDPQKIPNNHSFSHVPPLIFQIKDKEKIIPRFTDCGFEAHLQQPHKRYKREAAFMVPLHPGHATSISKKMKAFLQPCDETPSSRSEVARGQSLYDRNCKTCHDSDLAPVLHLGYPLLSFDYFMVKIKNGSHDGNNPGGLYKWQKEAQILQFQADKNAVKMPSFALSAQESQDLYAFLFQTPLSAKPSVNLMPKPSNLSDDELYRYATEQVFNTSCKHCHSPETKTQREIIQVFGSHFKKLPVFPLPQRAVEPSADLQQALSCDPKTKKSPLLERLLARHEEVSGGKTLLQKSIRGMPLTQEPIPIKAIENLSDWIQRSCPGPDHKRFCKPC